MMISLPAIFTPEPNRKPATVIVHDNSQWIEFISQLSRLSDRDIPDTQAHLQQLLDNEGDPSHRALVTAGIGRCQIREGKFLKGPKTLGAAFSMIPENDHDTTAFVLIEMAVFLANIDQYEHSKHLLEKTSGLTSNEYLKNLCHYYLLVQKSRTGQLEVVEELEASLTYFSDIKEYSTVAYHHKNIGNIYRKFKDYRLAQNHYDQAIQLAKKYKYPHITDAVLHDIGLLEFHQDHKSTAFKILEKVQSQSTSYYTRSFTLANIGFLHFSQKAWEPAIRSFEKSLDIAAHEGVFHLIPGISYYLGECYEHAQNLKMAQINYEKGYQTALELLSHHFSFSGDRKKAVEGYVNFLQKNPGQTSVSEPDLSFAIDKSLKDIRGIFQNALLNHLLDELGTNKAVIQELGIADKTFYLIRDRVKNWSDMKTPPAVGQFIQSSPAKSWQEYNKNFDQMVIPYLLQKYDRSKKTLSRKLDVSYTYALQLTGKGNGVTPVNIKTEKNG
ncbi:MAG: tetratricopeptide repeat protein [FCB group bacterium]|nr:tetratricopeptide repeat protein [FCB group bacterium]